ncbi:MAG: aldose epimerase family protein [Clostridia bacterium]|nr:aldose epimerase family protein [Clostridia bacterium]
MISTYQFGKTNDGRSITAYCMTNKNGSKATFLDYGLTLYSLCVPDGKGTLVDVVLGYPDPTTPMDGSFVGVTVGRVANRIQNAQFTIDGTTYHVPVNDNCNCLHGGSIFNERIWDVTEADGALLASCLSPDGEDGFPGTLKTTVRLSFSDDNVLTFAYHAQTDQKTPVNMTNHTYFNLMGKGTVLQHTLSIDADAVSVVDEMLIPHGELLPVDGTPFDFRTPKEVGRDIDKPHALIKIGGGYDCNFVLRGDGLRHAARLSAENGVVMDVLTDAPCVQLYIANFLPPKQGKDRVHEARGGLCLETQGYPNAMNLPALPSVLLAPGETCETVTQYAFSVSTKA